MARDKSPQIEFRIISGELKGRKITAPDLGLTRPPLTRLRKSVFDYLNPFLPGARYLDLFSGTGSYLFEAVSRGVSRAVGVELNSRLVNNINKQADKYDVSDRLWCFAEDVFKFIPARHELGQTFDIIMIAPPQYQGLIDRALQTLANHPVFTEDTLILCQHDTKETRKIDFANFQIVQRRKYGNTTYTVLKGLSL